MRVSYHQRSDTALHLAINVTVSVAYPLMDIGRAARLTVGNHDIPAMHHVMLANYATLQQLFQSIHNHGYVYNRDNCLYIDYFAEVCITLIGIDTYLSDSKHRCIWIIRTSIQRVIEIYKPEYLSAFGE